MGGGSGGTDGATRPRVLTSTPARHRSSLRIRLTRLTLAAMTDAPFGTLTGGTFATLLALALGASPMVVGLLAAVPSLGTFVPLVAAPWLNRMPTRRTALVGLGLARALWLAPLALLAAPADWPRPWLFLGAATLAAFAGSVGGLGWLAWVGDLVPARLRGRYFGRRGVATGVSAVMAGVAAGPLLDGRLAAHIPGGNRGGFALLLAVAVGFGLAGVAALSRVEEPAPAAPREAPRFSGAMRDTVRGGLGRYVAFTVLWHLALNVGGPFIPMFLVRDLRYSPATVALLAAVTTAATLFTARAWGRVADARGNLRVMRLTGLLAASLPAWWIAIGHLPFVGLAAVAHVASGIAWGGFNLAAANLNLAMVPPEGRALPLAVLGAATGLGAAVGPVIGGLLLDLLGRYPDLSLGLGAYGAVFAVSTIGRTAAFALLYTVAEPGRGRPGRPARGPSLTRPALPRRGASTRPAA